MKPKSLRLLSSVAFVVAALLSRSAPVAADETDCGDVYAYECTGSDYGAVGSYGFFQCSYTYSCEFHSTCCVYSCGGWEFVNWNESSCYDDNDQGYSGNCSCY